MYSNFNKGQEQLQTKIFSSQNLNLRTVKKKTDYQKFIKIKWILNTDVHCTQQCNIHFCLKSKPD